MNQLDSPVDFACSEYDLTIHIYWQQSVFRFWTNQGPIKALLYVWSKEKKSWNIKLWNLFLGEAFFRKIFGGHYREDFFLPRVIKSVVFSHLGLFQKFLKFSKNPFLWSFGIDLARKLYLNVKQFRFRPDA